MGGGQVGREGGLGAAGAADRAHREAAYETQQEHQGQVPAPAPVHGGARRYQATRSALAVTWNLELVTVPHPL